MKKLRKHFSVMSIFFCSLLTYSESKAQYISIGSGISGGQFGYGGEVGVYNERWWFAMSFDRTPSTKECFVGAKAYRKLFSVGKVDNYLHGALKVQTKEYYVAPEPGVAIVWNATKKFAPQLTVTTPIVKSYVYFAAGIGINYWIK